MTKLTPPAIAPLRPFAGTARRAGMSCRVGIASLVGLACLIAAQAARADHRPVIAVPGNWQVPVIVDGAPASGAMITGDWGLYAPGRVAPEVIGPVYDPISHGRGYYPKTGKRPRTGRQEVFVPRHLPPPAPTFYRSWTTESGRGPVTEYPPFDPPPVIRAPRDAW
jgi:hypothetical protein